MSRPFKQLASRSLLVLSLFTFIGCSGIPVRIVDEDKKVGAIVPSSAYADGAIAGATAAIKSGDLTEARSMLDKASNASPNDYQQMQIRSLQSVADGAEAMMEGDTSAAASHWSQIEDTELRRQMQIKARQYGINVPDTVATAQR